MMDGSQIQTRIRELLDRELERRIVEAGEKLPTLCLHNHVQPLDSRKEIHGQRNETYNRTSDPDTTVEVEVNGVLEKRHLPVQQNIGLCMLGAEDPTKWAGTICEDPIDAQRCAEQRGDFTPALNEHLVSEDFHAQIKDPGWVEENLPEVASLLWVLDGAEPPEVRWWQFWKR